MQLKHKDKTVVRLKGRDNLEDKQGRLGADFRAAALVMLRTDFLATAGEGREKAVRALQEFESADKNLRSKEQEFFNKRARRPETPSVMAHLRDAGHLATVREFHEAKENLLEINPVIGQRIIRLTEKNITAAPQRPGR